MYSRPLLNYDEHFATEGVHSLFSANGYKLAWLDYQYLLTSKLNALTKDRSIAGKSVKDLALRLAHNPAATSTFNHASMAHNNHFFFQQFSPHPRKLDQYPDLHSSLIDKFGTMDTLRTTFIDTAAAMFGGGFVWLVWARDPEPLTGIREGEWKIMCTYNAGTPYPEAGFMQQSMDMNTNDQISFTQYKQSNVGYFGPHSSHAKEKAKLPPGGTTVMPILCVSTWEHTYIYDFGLLGKMTYLDRFWDAIDWQIINNRAPKEISTAQYMGRSR